MTNIFQCSSDSRLKNWYDLRKQLEVLPIDQQCVIVDEWWQHAPLVNHYLHPDFILDWPTPWELLVDNEYCYFARGLGMIYTLYLLGIKDVELVEAKDYNNEDVVLVLVNSAKYILNYWPKTVVNNNLQDFKITKQLDLTPVIKKIG